VSGRDLEERFKMVLQKMVPDLPVETRDEFSRMLSPENLALMGAILAGWAISHAVGVGEAADLILLAIGVYSIGKQAVAAAGDLADCVKLTRNARTECDLDLAARKLARVVVVIGVTTFFVLIFKALGRLKRRPRVSPRVKMSGYGDLTAAELEKLKNLARRTKEPINVVGSTAKGTRRNVGTDLPLGKGPGTRSDLDIQISGEAEIRTGGRISDAIYEEFPKGKDVERILNRDPSPGEPVITIHPDGSVTTQGGVPLE
jgi:hypothetical protein